MPNPAESQVTLDLDRERRQIGVWRAHDNACSTCAFLNLRPIYEGDPLPQDADYCQYGDCRCWVREP